MKFKNKLRFSKESYINFNAFDNKKYRNLRGRNKFGNLCPNPLIKYSIKYVQTKPQKTRINMISTCKTGFHQHKRNISKSTMHFAFSDR